MVARAKKLPLINTLLWKTGDFIKCDHCKKFHVVTNYEVLLGFGDHSSVKCIDPLCSGRLIRKKKIRLSRPQFPYEDTLEEEETYYEMGAS